jgi:hypothetical protein
MQHDCRVRLTTLKYECCSDISLSLSLSLLLSSLLSPLSLSSLSLSSFSLSLFSVHDMVEVLFRRNIAQGMTPEEAFK